VRALPNNTPVNPTQMLPVLTLVRESFSCLDRCVQSSDDKEPRVTLLLLELLRKHGSPNTQSDIEEVQTFVLKQTEIAKHAN